MSEVISQARWEAEAVIRTPMTDERCLWCGVSRICQSGVWWISGLYWPES